MSAKHLTLGALAVASAVIIGALAGLVVSRMTDGGGARGAASAERPSSTLPTTARARPAKSTTTTTKPVSAPTSDEAPPTTARPTTAPAPPTLDVRSVDWERLSYEVADDGADVEIVPTTDESAEMGWAIGSSDFGDLDGDGHEDALVELYNIGPSVRPAAAFVILASDPEPRGLATRRVQYPVFPSGNIQEVTIDGRSLRLQAEDHGLGGSHGSPPNEVEATYGLRDGELVELSRTSTPKPDSIEGRFNAMVDAYLERDVAGVEALLGPLVDRLGDPSSWSSDLNDPSCREGVDTTEVVCALSPEGEQQVMITLDRFGGEVLDVFVGGGL